MLINDAVVPIASCCRLHLGGAGRAARFVRTCQCPVSEVRDTPQRTGAANPGTMASLLKLVTPANVLFGTDFPPGGTSRDVAKALAELGLGLTDADMRAINRDNAVRLLPRLAVS
jgi:predicted TIM-barrel fold metal-dependent hydrolase